MEHVSYKKGTKPIILILAILFQSYHHVQDIEANQASPKKDITLDALKVKFEDDDPQNPKNYSSSHKAFLVIQMAMLAMAGSLGSSIISPAATSIAEFTHTTLNCGSFCSRSVIAGSCFHNSIESC